MTFKEARQFYPDQTPWPEGVYQAEGCACPDPNCKCAPTYRLDTPDGTVEVFSGDYIVQTFDNQRYFVRVNLEY